MRFSGIFLWVLLSQLLALQALPAQTPGWDHIQEEAAMKAARLQRLREGPKEAGPRALDNYNIIYHRFVWEINPAVNAISGAVHTHFIAEANLSSVQFDLRSPLIVDSVKYHGVLKTFTHSSNLLSIPFSPSLPNGGLDSISVYYHGTPSTADDSWFATTHSGSPVISTLSEPYGARAWWPCKQNLSDKIDSMDAYIQVPTGNKAACNGSLVSTSVSGGNTTYHWRHRYPIAVYLVAVSVTNYSEYTDTIQIGSQVLNVLNYVYPENQAIWQAQSQAIRPMFRMLDELFIPYPFMTEKYGHAQFPWGGGMEHQTMSFMGGLNAQLIVHEGGHQWFGDRVTCGSWQHIWLNEGFATYCEGLASERGINGGTTWQLWKSGNRTRATADANGTVWVDDTTNVNRIFSSNLSYGKGGMLCHMLRWKLGDAAFFQGVRNYLNDPAIANGFASTSQLQAKLEASSGQNLSDFFNDWFYGKGYPSYQVQWYQVPTTNLLRIRINQTQSASSPNVAFFNIPLELVIVNSSGTQRDSFVLDPSFSGQVFEVPAAFSISQMLFDPNIRIISNGNTVTFSSLLPVQFQDFSGQWISDKSTKLDWTAAEEEDCLIYEIERSSNGLHFETKGALPCRESSPAHYSWIDQEAETTNFYRVAAVDISGKKEYTRLIRLSRDPELQVSIYPNPSPDGILQVDASQEIQGIRVFNKLGQEVFQSRQFGKKELREDLSFLPAGIYQVELQPEKGDRKILQWLR